MVKPIDIFIYVEDPGAANFVAELPAAISARGYHACLFAGGAALDYLKARGVIAEELNDPAIAFANAKPRLVVIGTAENPDQLGFSLVERARLEGIPSVGIVDARMNADYRFRGRSDAPLAHAPDALIVPDLETSREYAALGFPPERIDVGGYPHLDHVRKILRECEASGRDEIRRRLSIPVDRSVMVFVSEISGGLDPSQYLRDASYSLVGRGDSKGRTEIVIEEFLDAVARMRPRPWLVLRLHPKLHRRDLGALADEFDQVSEQSPALEWIYAADLVVGMTSALLMEAVVMKRPTLSVVPRNVECDWLPTNALGLTRCVTDRDTLRRVLCAPPDPCDDGAVDRAFPANATDRIADALIRRLEVNHR